MATISSPRPHSPTSSTRMQSPNVTQSPSDTPNSSVRTSLDLPTPTDPPAQTTTAQHRNRAALRDYYNLKSKQPGPHNLSRTASIASTASTATVTSTAIPEIRISTDTDLASTSTSISTAPLDDPSFEPEPYISSLLTSSNLKTVLKVEAILISELRNLDGERKALVYDNYSKLIKATRTIGGMRMNMNGEERGTSGRGGVGDRRVGGLSKDGMRDLGRRVEGVRRLADELGVGGVEGGVQEGAKEMKEAKKQREKRELVRWVLDGPQRLSKMVESGQMQEAEAEWKVIGRLLDKWDGVKGVEETRRDCEEAMRTAEVGGENNGAG
jgi:vacuolar protein sorting-associated protein 51